MTKPVWIATAALVYSLGTRPVRAHVVPEDEKWRDAKDFETPVLLNTSLKPNGVPDPAVSKQPTPTLSRYNRIDWYYHCPRLGPATRYFELGVVYTAGETDTVEWKRYTNVDGFRNRNRRDRQPIKATSIFYHDTCPPNQSIDSICSYHFEGHLSADIYTHFIAMEMIQFVRTSDLRAPFVWESCIDMSRRPHGAEHCGAVPHWQLCVITNIAFAPFHPPPE